MADNVQLSPLAHVGVIVRDLEKSVALYESTFGIGPFRRVELKREGIFRGQPTTFSCKIALAELGPVNLELIEPLEGPSTWAEHLATKGEGLHHLGFAVANLEQARARLAEQGIPLLQSAMTERGGFAYFDPDATTGIVFEMFQRAQQ